MPPPAPVQKPQKTLIVTHLECANHVTPALMGTDYVAGAAAPFASPEQPERVKAVWAALKQCAWTCGGTKIVDTVELATSPTLNRGLNDTLERFASPETGPFEGPPGAPKRQSPTRTASVEFLFDDLEPVVLRVHVRSRRPAVLRCLHAIDATRFHQTRSWVVSFPILRPFGPRRDRDAPRRTSTTYLE